MKYVIQVLSLFIMVVISSTANATTMCDTTDVQLDTVQLAYDPIDPATPILNVSPTYSSECIGLLSGNDNPAPSGSNIGEYGDGLLNGEAQTGGNIDSWLAPYNTLFDPLYLYGLDGIAGNTDDSAGPYNDNLAFIEPADLQDWDGDGDHTDPGWVYLGKDDGEVGGFDYASVGDDLDIGSVVDIEFTCAIGGSIDGCTAGTWSIMPDFDIATTLFDFFGEGVFDHLAIVFKSGNVDQETSGPDWAIYDFNFNTLFNGALDLTMPYNLGGSFDMGTVFDGHGISHISVWARDPEFTSVIITEIPEPKSTMLMLFALGLLVLGFKSKRIF